MPQVTEDYLEARRAGILEAAFRCFARQGFRDTTMQEIAAEAGLSVGALYRYFEGRESLIEALAEGGQASRREALKAIESGAGSGGLNDLMARLLDQLPAEDAAADALRFDVRIWGEALGHPQLQDLVAGVFQGIRDPVLAYVRGEQRCGGLRADVDAEAIALVIVALLAGLEVQLAFDARVDRAAYAAVVGRLLSGLEGSGGSDS
jgi:AcrR family transcriptional regulator